MTNDIEDPWQWVQGLYNVSDDKEYDQLSVGNGDNAAAFGSTQDLLAGTKVQTATITSSAAAEELSKVSVSEDPSYVNGSMPIDFKTDAVMTAMTGRKEAETKETALPQLKETDLREMTHSEISRYSDTDKHPPHPNHGRNWHSKNLWCATCKMACGVCNKPCCALVGASRKDLQTKEAEKNKSILTEIKKMMVCGRDESTFLQCETCYKWVCQDCSGICPVSICQEKRCNKCVPEPFSICDWHEEYEIPVFEAKAEVFAVSHEEQSKAGEDKVKGEKAGGEKGGNKKEVGKVGVEKMDSKKVGDKKKIGKD